MPPAPAPYRVLSIDGGGIRGLLTTVVLQRLVATPGLGHLLDAADLIAGTSTGGLLALGIAHQIALATIGDLYVTKGPKIFDDSWLDDLVDLGKIRGADYDIEPLQRELRVLFGATTLAQLEKRVLITTFDVDNEDEVPRRRTWNPSCSTIFPARTPTEASWPPRSACTPARRRRSSPRWMGSSTAACMPPTRACAPT